MTCMLRWLVIGVGDITTKRVIPAILQEGRSRLYGIVTCDPAKAAPYGVRAFLSLDEALADGAFDAVYVASPVFLHATQTIQSLLAGHHVLCEKPMAMNPAESQAMLDAARTSGWQLGVAYYRRTYPKVNRAVELLREGVIGQPVSAYVSCHNWFTASDGKRAWLLEPAKAGGGPLYDIGCHRIDLLNYVFGQPLEVRALLSNAVHQTAVEDSATVLIKYQQQIHAIVDVRWQSRVTRDEFRIFGVEGEIDLTPLNDPQLVSPAGREEIPNHSNLHFPCIKNFVGAITAGEPLLSSGATAWWTDWVIQNAVASGSEKPNKL
ncbi:MAG: Gfo/Idh/MocA family protein [Terriglobia bacterium]